MFSVFNGLQFRRVWWEPEIAFPPRGLLAIVLRDPRGLTPSPNNFGVWSGIRTWHVLNASPKLRAGSDINFIELFVRTMADPDKLVLVGFETTMLEESMAQDDSFEGDRSLQPYPEVTLATVTTSMLRDPHHQISLTVDLASPMGATPNSSRSASPKPFDLNKMRGMENKIVEQREGSNKFEGSELRMEQGNDGRVRTFPIPGPLSEKTGALLPRSR